MKQNMSLQEQDTARRLEIVQAKLNERPMWHLKRRKADSTRIWKHLYKELVAGFEMKLFRRFPLFEIEVNTHSERFTIKTFKSVSTSYKSICIKEADIQKTLHEVNSALIHYQLRIVEKGKPDSVRRQYTVEFVEPEVKSLEK